MNEIEQKIQEAMNIVRNMALTQAAQVAEALYDKTYWDDPVAGIAAQIRKLKEDKKW